MRKIRVVVLAGGKSPEHEISLLSGKNVEKNLDRRKYEVLFLEVPKKENRINLQRICQFLSHSPALPAGRPARGVVFIAMYGPYGEDGTVQGMLEFAGLPYTGSGVLASVLGMDKIMFRKVMEREVISAPRYFG